MCPTEKCNRQGGETGFNHEKKTLESTEKVDFVESKAGLDCRLNKLKSAQKVLETYNGKTVHECSVKVQGGDDDMGYGFKRVLYEERGDKLFGSLSEERLPGVLGLIFGT